jgi:hypothetical protein
MDRILRDAAGQLDLLTYDSTGALADVDGTNAPAVVVTDSAGVTVVGFTPSRTATGVYQATLPANLEILDTYEVAWNFSNGQTRRSEFELVGGFLFTVADVRALNSQLADTVAYPAAAIRRVRAEVEDVFEDPKITARAFRPRGRRLTVDGNDTDTLTTPDFDITSVVSASITGTAVTLTYVTIQPWGGLKLSTGTWTSGVGNVSLLYEYGMRATPAKVRREALVLAKSYLQESPLQEGRATAVFTDIGGYRLTIAGRDGWTGIPSVDACLSQYSLASRVVVG